MIHLLPMSPPYFHGWLLQVESMFIHILSNCGSINEQCGALTCVLAHGTHQDCGRRLKAPGPGITLRSPKSFLLLMLGPTQALQNYQDQAKLSHPDTLQFHLQDKSKTSAVSGGWGYRAHGSGRGRQQNLKAVLGEDALGLPARSQGLMSATLVCSDPSLRI